MSSPSKHILISGAGIAGPVLALFLSRAGIDSTVIERFPTLRTSGQTIDIRGAGLEVVRKISPGIEALIRSKTTKELGIAFVDGDGRRWAEFPAAAGGFSPSSDIEIVRGVLAGLFYEASLSEAERKVDGEDGDAQGTQKQKGKVEYIFGDYVTAIQQDEKGVHATLASGTTRTFDLLIAADGQSSRTRGLVFAPEEVTINWLGMYTAYFSAPMELGSPTWSQWYSAPGGRCQLLRPDGAGQQRAFLSIISSAPTAIMDDGIAAQKAMNRRLHADGGWKAGPILDAMDAADDFYMQSVVQVKMNTWHKGRVALLGDAGYCASPISGMGTTLAIVGAYMLAGCIAEGGDDHEAAFKRYEELMRPFVDTAQKLPPGAPALANPQSRWGILVLYSLLWIVSHSGVLKLFEWFGGPRASGLPVPVFEVLV